MELRTFQSTVITRRLPKNAVMERGIFSAIKKIFRFCHFGFSMQNGDSEIVTELPKSSVVLFKVVIFQRCLLRLKKVMARVDILLTKVSIYLQGLPNNRFSNQYFDRRISYNTFPTRCPNDKKKTKQNLFQMKVTEHKQPFTSVNQACYLYETAT